ncbi:MAG: hypothetical protein NXI23_21030 [Bacteroidetes bacterium]|jgi:hypothetical protein|nr:hypothetical protein [Bacteroidota bacterium]
MLQQIKKTAINTIVNTIGWHTNKKIIVFESDDWGMVRTSSTDAYKKLKKVGLKVDDCPYTSVDALESNDDVTFFMEVLSQFRDKNGNPPIFTLNNIVGNPDFEKIEASNFQDYHYERFTETYSQYPKHDKVFSLLKEGLEKGMFKPQLHGREHVNVVQWMNALKENKKYVKLIFNQKMYSAHIDGVSSCRREYLQSFGRFTQDDLNLQKSIIKEGAELFKDIWGFHSKSFIAPCYTWSEELEKELSKNKVQYLQGTHVHKIPQIGGKKNFKKRYRFLGEKNIHKQTYIVRNCWFEPSQNPNIDNYSLLLKQINQAFKFRKPAVICSHRLNYMGFLSPQNRDENLVMLKKALKEIIKKWPTVEFLSTNQLGDLISQPKGIQN